LFYAPLERTIHSIIISVLRLLSSFGALVVDDYTLTANTKRRVPHYVVNNIYNKSVDAYPSNKYTMS